jgi:hypothetical protein
VARFFVILSATFVTGLGLGLIGTFVPSADLPVVILGMEPVCVASVNPCWLAFGGGTGVLVVGVGGVGLVALTVYGAGIFFATGQLAAGLLAIGQAGVGVIGWIGQVGAGMTGVGQLIFGWLVRGQLPIGADGAAFHQMLGRQLKSTLSRPGSPYDLDASTHP